MTGVGASTRDRITWGWRASFTWFSTNAPPWHTCLRTLPFCSTGSMIAWHGPAVDFAFLAMSLSSSFYWASYVSSFVIAMMFCCGAAVTASALPVVPCATNIATYCNCRVTVSIADRQAALWFPAIMALVCNSSRSWKDVLSLLMATELAATFKYRQCISRSNAENTFGKIPKSKCSTGMETWMSGMGRIAGRTTLLKFLAFVKFDPASTYLVWSLARDCRVLSTLFPLGL